MTEPYDPESLEAVIEYFSQRADADQWQPIETAPKDKPIVGAWWNEPRGAWVARDVFWDKVRSCWACPYEEFYIMPPTHWQPLPTPPARSALLALDNEAAG